MVHNIAGLIDEYSARIHEEEAAFKYGVFLRLSRSDFEGVASTEAHKYADERHLKTRKTVEAIEAGWRAAECIFIAAREYVKPIAEELADIIAEETPLPPNILGYLREGD